MERKEIEKWLRSLCEVGKVFDDFCYEYRKEGIECIRLFENYVQIYSGIRKVAEAIGVDVKEEFKKVDGHAYIRLSFFFEGTEFFQLGEK